MPATVIDPNYIPENYKQCEEILLMGLTGNVTLDLSHCKILKCSTSQITSLPPLPNCEVLECGINQITSLPDLP